MSSPPSQPAGWYYAQGDPPGTQRYWDGQAWQGSPQPVVPAGQPVVPGAPTAVGVAPGAELTSVGKRYGGRFLDYLVWWLISGLVSATLGGSSQFSLDVGQRGDMTGRVIAATVVSALLIGAYETILVARSGATLGKMAVGAKVMNPDGSPTDMATAAKRIAPFVVVQALSSFSLILQTIGGFVILGLLVAGMVMLSVDKRRQTPWDKLAGTEVRSS